MAQLALGVTGRGSRSDATRPVARTRLEEIAPRLARARAERLVELRQERAERRHALRLLLRAEQRVAHRELQLVRAMHTQSARYIRRRTSMLEEARGQLVRAQRRARQLGIST